TFFSLTLRLPKSDLWWVRAIVRARFLLIVYGRHEHKRIHKKKQRPDAPASRLRASRLNLLQQTTIEPRMRPLSFSCDSLRFPFIDWRPAPDRLERFERIVVALFTCAQASQ